MKLTVIIHSKNRVYVADCLRQLAKEIQYGTDNNAAGHFGSDADFEYELLDVDKLSPQPKERHKKA